jgi:flavorubredoxin
MKVGITKIIDWVGKIDWEIRKFHGHELSTNRGTSYNSYLIRDSKTVLIDTVARPFAKEFVRNLIWETNLDQIDYVVANHAEPDHSGALPELMKLMPGKPILCTKNCAESLRGHYHEDWNFQIVKTGDRIPIGKNELLFIEAPLLHWPDSMFTYATDDKVLFSNDAFGQHLATEFLTNDRVDQSELYAEALKYYANILTRFSPLVKAKIAELTKLDLPISMIAPSHGAIWRKKPMQIVEQYAKWADSYHENQITIIYDTMWGATRMMAEYIAKGIVKIDPKVTVKLFKVSNSDKNDIITEIFKSKAVIIGSPTINSGEMSEIAGLLREIGGHNFKEKKAAVFGSYGWSGEAPRRIYDSLKASGFNMIDDGLKYLWQPDDQALENCIAYGEKIAVSSIISEK